MSKRRFNADKIFWGFCFLGGAAALIFSKLGYLTDISILSVFLTILFLWMFIKGLATLNFGEILFSVALMACVYAKPLGITELTPWTVLGAALLGTIGLNLLFPKKHKWHVHSHPQKDEEVIDIPDEEVIHFSNSFGGTIKYINSDNFKKANLETSFGEMKAYFDNAVIQQGTAQVNIKASFGAMILYIPKTWKIVDNTSVSFGALEIKNPTTCEYQEGNPVLYITGEVAFGGAEIYYV